MLSTKTRHSRPSSPSRNNNLCIVAMLLAAFALPGCSEKVAESDSSMKIIATTGQINSALQRLSNGTDTHIHLLCGPGVDPHSYSASSRDVQAMQDADAIFYNGFHLEARLEEHLQGVFKTKSWSMASAFPTTIRLDWIEDGEIDPHAPFDPHIWNHLPGWAACVQGLANRLTEIDPANAATYKKNADDYVSEINEAHDWAKVQLEKIPQRNRTIVSAHDAFNYFANVYDMNTIAVLGIGNDPEADIQSMRNVALTICQREVPAIFLESITNPKVTEALQEACAARNWNVVIVQQPLYSDDLGESAPHNTFLGAFRSNVNVIVNSLSPEGT